MTTDTSADTDDKELSEPPPRRAVVYLSDRGIEYVGRRTLDQQDRACQSTAEWLEVDVVATYVDIAMTLGGALRTMRSRLVEGDIDYVIAFSQRYLCERHDDYRDFWTWAERLGVQIISADVAR
jgi:hypothetical protein